MDITKDDLMAGLFGSSIGNSGQESSEIAQRRSNLIKTLTGNTIENIKNEIIELDIELLDRLSSFDHPFEKSVLKGLDELAHSIRINGLWIPIIVRDHPKARGRYEILAGHRRTAATKLADIKKIKAIYLKDCDDDTAKLIVTETNTLNREELYPSEKARAYKLQLEALKNQGKRNDLIRAIEGEEKYSEDFGPNWAEVKSSQDKENNTSNFGPNRAEVKSNQDNENNASNFGPIRAEVKYARDVVAELNNTSRMEISRYIRLNKLIFTLLDRVDEKEIPVNAAVELSYLCVENQETLENVLAENDKLRITIPMAGAMRAVAKDNMLTSAIIKSILVPTTKNKTIARPYKIAFKEVEKYIKKLDYKQAETLALADAKELENIIKETIESYINSLSKG
ncbi:ParB/RepB/Spo0J family partition protein [Aminipila butyrica]|uniref:ParB/RepB/Spo0J family partition protein n=1 Tax=Aminipila butyrica TaxID=433296 RepID=A0A858BXH1_9FIRM|nr:ParB/RepB/Spo0J family partition protein [Aminipila butyrica]QIB69808.1 ParB/RepB/Spo0J family partition protein [Aminipila butyrica]